MNQYLLLPILIVVLWGCFSSHPRAEGSSRPTVAEASASSCDAAIRQAKRNATDQVAGTFVHARRTLIQDRDYSEEMSEYSSGIVERYVILDKTGGNPCKVRIQAWVVSGPEAVNLKKGSTDIGVDEINLRADQISNNRHFLVQHLRDTHEFRVDLSKLDIRESTPGAISVRTEITHITPSQRWLNDLEAFLSIHGPAVVYEQDSRKKALERLFSFEASGTKQPPASWEFEICFAHKDRKQVRCYTGEHNRKIIRVLRSAVIELSLHRGNGAKHTFPPSSAQFGFYSHKPLGNRYTAPGFEARSDFPLIEPWPLPLVAGFDLTDKRLPADARITGSVRFTDVSQFPLNSNQK